MADSDERRNVIEMLELYRCLPALWDVNCADYRNPYIRRQQKTILLQKYRQTNPTADKKELAKKINTLRSNYNREVRRLRNLKSCGTAKVCLAVVSILPNLSWGNLSSEESLNHYNYPKTANNHSISFSTTKAGLSPLPSLWDVAPNKQTKPSCANHHLHQHPESNKFKPSSLIDDLVRLTMDRLKRQPNTLQEIGNIWGFKLMTMEFSQRIIAEKLVNDIIFNGELGRLNYDTSFSKLGSPAKFRWEDEIEEKYDYESESN